MVKLINTKGNIGHGAGGVRADQWQCWVCGLTTKETGADIFNLPAAAEIANDPETGKKERVARWMCGNCLAQALDSGLLVLYHNPGGKAARPLEMELPVEIADGEPEAAFEVSW